MRKGFRVRHNKNKMHSYKDYYENDPQERLGFVRKVYGILSVMLTVTVLMCVPSVVSKTYANWQ